MLSLSYRKIMNEYEKRMDDNLPYYHVRGGTAAPKPFDDPNYVDTRKRRKRQHRRDDAGSDMIGRANAGQQQAQTIRQRHHRVPGRLPPPGN